MRKWRHNVFKWHNQREPRPLSPVYYCFYSPCCEHDGDRELAVDELLLLAPSKDQLKFPSSWATCWLLIEVTTERQLYRYAVFLPIWLSRHRQNPRYRPTVGYRDKNWISQWTDWEVRIQGSVNSHFLVSVGHRKQERKGSLLERHLWSRTAAWCFTSIALVKHRSILWDRRNSTPFYSSANWGSEESACLRSHSRQLPRAGFITSQPDPGTAVWPICCSFIGLTESFDNVGFAVVLTGAQASLQSTKSFSAGWRDWLCKGKERSGLVWWEVPLASSFDTNRQFASKFCRCPAHAPPPLHCSRPFYNMFKQKV